MTQLLSIPWVSNMKGGIWLPLVLGVAHSTLVMTHSRIRDHLVADQEGSALAGCVLREVRTSLDGMTRSSTDCTCGSWYIKCPRRKLRST